MRGLMMDRPLLISALIEHAGLHHGDTKIAGRLPDGAIAHSDWAALLLRVRKLAQALERLGVKPGDRVATLAWNTIAHLEAYFAISSIGAICHTLNPRLHGDDLIYIVNHAEDSVLFFDPTLAPLVEKLRPYCPCVRDFIIMGDARSVQESGVAGAPVQAALIEAESGEYDFPLFDENLASSLCYTSGTTGRPKGVLYSHRATVLHSYAVALPDCFHLSAASVVLPVVPMFHVNAWGIPYAAALAGAKLVMPGHKLDGRSLHEMITTESVTQMLGVPTVWLALLDHLDSLGAKLTGIERIVVGGAALSEALLKRFEEDHDTRVIHAWGMTEMSPLGVAGALKPKHAPLAPHERRQVQLKQGRAIFGVDMRIVDDQDREMKRDGETPGHLQVRGPWIASAYFRQGEDAAFTADGWFRTGDVATLDADGYMRITDRAKDVIKSGGEWISSLDIENAAMTHPAIAEAAVIGVPHQKWQERPLLIVKRRAGSAVESAEIRAHLETRIASWWMPDRIEFIEEIPHGATGKVAKVKLRAMFAHITLEG